MAFPPASVVRLYAVRFAEALRNHGSYRHALQILDTAYGPYSLSSELLNGPIIASVLRADILRLSKNDVESALVCLSILRYLDKFAPTIKNEDKKYVLYWIKWLLSSLTGFIDSEAYMAAAEIKLYYQSLDMSRVSTRLRRMLPFTENQALEFERVSEINEATA